jgi:Na+-translocating ferredoxin:NAD+ oxidoreductase subunit C
MISIFKSFVPIRLEGHKLEATEADVLQLDENKIPSVYIPIVSPNGGEIDLFVKEGDQVQVGTLIGRRKDYYVPIFSSISGVVKGKVTRYNPIVGRATNHLEIVNDFKKTMAKPLKTVSFDSDPKDIVAAIKEAGLVGLGGAGFPTYFKYEQYDNIDTIIINGVECEPYLSTDYKLTQFHALDVIQGSELLRLAAQADKAIIALKKDKTVLIEVLKKHLNNFPHVTIKLVKDIYPMGWERLLVKRVLKRTYNDLPKEVNVIVNNIGTAMATGEALIKGRPITHRTITISGNAIKKSVNIQAPIGTPISHIVEEVGGYSTDEVIAFGGGPMTSKAVSDDSYVLQAPMSGYTAIKPVSYNQVPCLRCGACTASCPAGIQPIEIKLALDSNNVDRLMKLNVNRCVDCGICSYVCPSFIEVADATSKAKVKVRIENAKREFAKKGAVK